MSKPLLRLAYTLQIADNALIVGHRISEWCGHGPALEQDIAITNTALDHIGQARSAFQHAAALYNALAPEEQVEAITSPAIAAVPDSLDEDDLAYLRDAWDFRNCLLAEQPNGDWAHTVARSFFYDVYQFYFYLALQQSADETLAAIAEKSFKEVTYHRRWSSEWVIRLGDGTDESHVRMQEAINALWPYTGELFKATEADAWAAEVEVGPDPASLRQQWMSTVGNVLREATLQMPDEKAWMHEGGKEGRHTEHLGYILAEMQFMQRTYPNMEW